MIKLKEIVMRHGETTLIFEADGFPSGIREIAIPLSEVIERMKSFSALIGRKPSLQEVKEMIIVLVNELRRQREPFVKRYDFSAWIGVDLEAEA